MSCTLKDNLPGALHLTKELNDTFSDSKIGIGGQALQLLTEKEHDTYGKYLIGNSEEEWENWLLSARGYTNSPKSSKDTKC